MENKTIPPVLQRNITAAPTLIDPTFAIDEQSFITQVFGWMAIALCISAAAAGFIASSPSLSQLVFGNHLIFYGLLILEIIMVAYLSSMVKTMSLAAARLTFILYSALNGITLGFIFLVYTASSIALALVITAGVFGAMALYGYYTKTDLTAWGNLLGMLLFGLVVATLVNLFWLNSTLDWITTYAGIFIFVGLTAYDTQKIKDMNTVMNTNSDADKKEAIMGALTLYLDFINLFLKFLRIFGKRK